MQLTVVGLGPGDPGLLTLEAHQALRAAPEVLTTAPEHPALAGLPVRALEPGPGGLAEVLRLARRPEGAVYAVPGSPLAGHPEVRELLDRAAAEGLPVRLAAGLAPWETALTALRLDPLAAGLQVLRAPDAPADAQRPALILGAEEPDAPAALRARLLDRYPADHRVTLLSGGVARALPLSGLDPAEPRHGAALYLPALPPYDDLRSFAGLTAVMARLRSPEGCPWDRQQTHQTLKANLLEETYEVLQALDEDDPKKLAEELGDLLIQVVFHTQIAIEQGEFGYGDVIGAITGKLVRRHPHVFGDVAAATPEEVLSNWERIKAQERAAAGREEATSMLAAIPPSMPALAYSQMMQDRAARVGFEWRERGDVMRKLVEELEELARADSTEERRHEFGDVLFVLTNVARRLGVDAEDALRLAARRFYQRFSTMEAIAQERGTALEQLSLVEQERLWEEAKRRLGSGQDRPAGRPDPAPGGSDG
ncbi:MAG TPA: nucleoside triphosphate pyrophosphohydrolase [Dehalococcoidia bacterium]